MEKEVRKREKIVVAVVEIGRIDYGQRRSQGCLDDDTDQHKFVIFLQQSQQISFLFIISEGLCIETNSTNFILTTQMQPL